MPISGSYYYPTVSKANSSVPLVQSDGSSYIYTRQVSVGIPTVLSPTGTSQTINWNLGNSQILDLSGASGDVALTMSNPVSGGSYCIKIIQHNSASRNVTFPASCKWQGGSSPTITTTTGSIDVVSLLYDGLNYFCNIGQNYR